MSDPMSNAHLSIHKVVKEYPQGKAAPLRVLKGISLRIRQGELVVIAGPSGSGNSTLLHIMGLLDRPTSGEVRSDGRDLARCSSYEQSRLRNQLFGFVFQFFHLLPDFTALENVVMPSMVQHGALAWPRQRNSTLARATQLLTRVGLAHRMSHRPAQLSGGERQRVALCRALINQPRLLLLDEPTGNLDSRIGAAILDLVHELNEIDGQTIVMVTHDENAARTAGRIVRLRDGEIVEG